MNPIAVVWSFSYRERSGACEEVGRRIGKAFDEKA
jgi:hypothetical protein